MTGDALHCERESIQLSSRTTATSLFFNSKATNPPRWREAQRIAAAGSPPFACDTRDRGHGRIDEHRHIEGLRH